jgi:hypothetical protein
MATVKKGILTSAGEWWKHLRPYGKRDFWKGERKAAERDADTRVREVDALDAIDREIDFTEDCYRITDKDVLGG